MKTTRLFPAIIIISIVGFVVASALGASAQVLVSIALLSVTAMQVLVSLHQADAASTMAGISERLENQPKYLHLARLWYELKTQGLKNSEWIDPAFSTLYRPESSITTYRDYHTYAWMCWGHAEDCFVAGLHEDPGFLPSIKSYKELHWSWLNANRKIFGKDFLPWIDEMSVGAKVESRPSHLHGQGVFATEDIGADDFIGYFSGTYRKFSTGLSIQFGERLHIEPSSDSVLKDLNHDCEANARFLGRNLYARVPILTNDEVTIDYNCSELDLRQPFPCACQRRDCVGTISGWRSLSEQQKELRVGSDEVPDWLLTAP